MKDYKLKNWKIVNKSLIITVISIILTGCISVNLSKLDTYYTPIPETSKKIDIPKYKDEHQFKGYPYIYWNFCKQKQNQLGLTQPEISNDSLIFRIWITNPVGRKRQPHGLIEIKNDSTGWNGKLILMRVNFKLKNLTETVTEKKIIELKPLQTNWKNVIDILKRLRIADLPTDDLIPNYYVDNPKGAYSNTAPTFSFEYATPDIYRFYQYNNVYRFAGKFWQPKNVIDILDLLENEFNWDTEARKFF
jgi:hypothetical protein